MVAVSAIELYYFMCSSRFCVQYSRRLVNVNTKRTSIDVRATSSGAGAPFGPWQRTLAMTADGDRELQGRGLSTRA